MISNNENIDDKYLVYLLPFIIEYKPKQFYNLLNDLNLHNGKLFFNNNNIETNTMISIIYHCNLNISSKINGLYLELSKDKKSIDIKNVGLNQYSNIETNILNFYNEYQHLLI